MNVNGYTIAPGANLTHANLTGTCLDPAAVIPPIPDQALLNAGFELRRGRVYGWRTAMSRHVGSTEYLPGRTYTAPVFSVAPTECHPGLYLDGGARLESQYPGAPLVRCSCRREDIHKAGRKFRTRKLHIQREAK